MLLTFFGLSSHSRAGCSFGAREMYISFIKITGCYGGLALLLSFAMRALNGMLFSEFVSWMDNPSVGGDGASSSKQPRLDLHFPTQPESFWWKELYQWLEDLEKQIEDGGNLNLEEVKHRLDILDQCIDQSYEILKAEQNRRREQWEKESLEFKEIIMEELKKKESTR